MKNNNNNKMDEVKETSQKVEEAEKEIDRTGLNLQQFMNDMRVLGDQVKDRDLVKPAFHYGDLAVTNYLLWLMLGESMKLNDGLVEEEE